MINTALSGSNAAQAALNTTSQNIANVMTPGYTRQGELLAALQPLQGGADAAGSGVDVPHLLRFSDGYASQQLWTANSQKGQFDVGQPYLTQLEQVMGSGTSSINTGLDGFFSALNAASVDPSSSPLRQQVITAAGALSQSFNSLAHVLADQRNTIYQQRASVVNQINSLSATVADLNKQISASQGNGITPSGLLDQRDQAVDALAKLVGVQVLDQPNGLRNVSLTNGQPLVVGNTAATMAVQNNANGSQTLTLAFAQSNFTLSGSGLAGQLGGLNDLEQNVLVPTQQALSDMAGSIATSVNNQLGAGYAMNGAAGGPLFDYNPASSTALLSVHAGVQAQDLAFSGNPATPGDSSNLLQVIAIKNQPAAITGLGNVTLSDAYTQLVGVLGTASQQNQAAQTTAQTVRTQAEESWKSISGVNQDEEATNLVQYQQMYQANMKVISVARQLFDSTLQMMG
jgi:flagellar hook-associated protein 1 FlgK